MITQLAIGIAVAAGALGVAWWLRRRVPDGPPRDAYPVPRQVARADFERPDAPWLVAYFSSAACASCAGLGPKVEALESRDVATCELPFETRRDIHDRYRIEAIPMVLIVDADGVVCRAFVGATTATDLWAATAEARSPGSTPEADLGVVF
ncbi:MAG TPA: thioredoxin family protein [Acidimicrobiia bacterium]